MILNFIFRNREFKVLVGTDKVDEGGKLYDVEKIIVHEEYSNITSDYDVCLLKLNESLTFGPKVAKVSLPGDVVTVKKGTLLNVTGWGYTNVSLIEKIFITDLMASRALGESLHAMFSLLSL